MREEKEWKKDLAQEYLIYSLPSWLSGVWPLLPDNFFTAIRFYVAVILLVTIMKIIFNNRFLETVDEPLHLMYSYFTENEKLCFHIKLFQFSTILTLCSELIRGCGDARQITDQLVFCAVILNSTTKTILLRIFRKQVLNIYEEAEHDWSTTEDEEHLKIMESHRKFSRKVYFYEAAVHYILLAMYMIAPKLSEDEKILPLQTVCLAKNISEIGYQGIYLLQCLQSLYVFNGNVGTDFFFFAIVMHICGQVEILRVKLSKIAKDDFHDVEHEEKFEEGIQSLKRRTINEKEFPNCMKSLVRRHIKLLNLANDVQNTLSITLLVQLTTSIGIMCLLGIQTLLFLQAGDTISAGRTTSGFLIVSLGLFLYCYMGDYIQFQFGKVSEAAYFCNWYNFSPKISRNIIIIQIRASSTINLSAGKMCVMNLEMFKTAIKTAMSFFSFMRVLLEEEEDTIKNL